MWILLFEELFWNLMPKPLEPELHHLIFGTSVDYMGFSLLCITKLLFMSLERIHVVEL